MAVEKRITNEQSDILLPCPFCGNKAYIVDKGGLSRVECIGKYYKCPVLVRTVYKKTDEAIKAWNTRAQNTGLGTHP